MFSKNEFIFPKKQHLRAVDFSRLHQGGNQFIMPNPWDCGTAIVMEKAGFKALGTTSAGLAFSLGKIDRASSVTLQDTLDNILTISQATTLPLSADLEDGFGKTASEIKLAIYNAAKYGAVGGSIEDYTGEKSHPIRDFSASVECIEAAVESANSLPFPFLITARAENFLYGNYDLKDTIARLQAYEKAGADVLYAPALPDAASIKAICLAVEKPVNVLLGAGNQLSIPELFQLGVTRVSIGSALSRAALGGFIRALQEIKFQGSCKFNNQAVGYFDVETLLKGKKL